MSNIGRATRLIPCAAGLLVLSLGGCGGGQSDDPGPIVAPHCTGASCGAVAKPPAPPASSTAALCPATLDDSTVYTGGTGSGEYVKLQFDTARQTYRIRFIESSVPVSAGQINQTRAGLVVEGHFHHPNTMPTPEQNRCSFVLDDGVSTDGRYTVDIHPDDPPKLFVGQGVAGGGIPGATIAFAGIDTGVALGLPPGIVVVGTVPARQFDAFPFLGFAETETDFSKIAGVYNELGLHLSPTGTQYQTSAPQGWQPDVVDWRETLEADGSCVRDPDSDYSCRTSGTPWRLRSNADGSPDQVFVSQTVSAGMPYPGAGQSQPIVLTTPSQAHGILIAGRLDGQIVPVVIRVGYSYADSANPLASVADPEIGISVLAPVAPVPPLAVQGTFVGATSAVACGAVGFNGPSPAPALSTDDFDAAQPHPDLPGTFRFGSFYPSAGACTDGSAVSNPLANYPVTLFQGSQAAFIDPQTFAARALFSLDYSQASGGKVGVRVSGGLSVAGGTGAVALFKPGDSGALVKAGQIYAMVLNNSQYNPFFAVGAFVQ